MAFRGDIQGGQAAPMSGAFAPGGGLVGGQGVSGIEKTLKWKLMFFGGACVTLAGGIIPFFYHCFHLEWAPLTFLDTIFLVIFGIVMVVLDFPIPHPSGHLVAVRDSAYKFLLFMTRFTGRGLWYLFLATLVFEHNCRDIGQAAFFIGCIFAIYLTVLGVCALGKGYMLSSRLDKVRQEITKVGHGAEHYVARNQNGLSKAQFQAMVDAVLINQDTKFTSDELDYIINALSFTPYNDGQVSLEECEYWLRSGPMLCV